MGAIIPDVREGYRRQWCTCRTCGRLSFYDYVPYSLSNPVRTLPCGHGAGEKFLETVDYVSADEAIILLSKGEAGWK